MDQVRQRASTTAKLPRSSEPNPHRLAAPHLPIAYLLSRTRPLLAQPAQDSVRRRPWSVPAEPPNQERVHADTHPAHAGWMGVLGPMGTGPGRRWGSELPRGRRSAPGQFHAPTGGNDHIRVTGGRGGQEGRWHLHCPRIPVSNAEPGCQPTGPLPEASWAGVSGSGTCHRGKGLVRFQSTQRGAVEVMVKANDQCSGLCRSYVLIGIVEI